MNETEWLGIATALKFEDEAAMWRYLYAEQGMSVTQLSNLIGVAKNTVSRRVRMAKIVVRGRGGPNRLGMTRFKDIPDEAFQLKVHELAILLKMHPSTVFKEKRKRKEQNGESTESRGSNQVQGDGVSVYFDKAVDFGTTDGHGVRGVREDVSDEQSVEHPSTGGSESGEV